MAPVRHFGSWSKAYLDHSAHCGTPKFGEDSLIGGGDMPLKRNLKKLLLAPEFYIRFHGWRLHAFGDLHMCTHAKFQLNRTSGGQIMAIQIIQDGHCSPSWIMNQSVFDHSARCGTPLSTIYIHNKFGEDIFVGGGDMPPRNFTSGFNMTSSVLRGPSHVSAKSGDRLQSDIDFTILLFGAHFGSAFPSVF